MHTIFAFIAVVVGVVVYDVVADVVAVDDCVVVILVETVDVFVDVGVVSTHSL